MEYQTIKENGKVKFVVIPVKSFNALLERLEDEADLLAIGQHDRRELPGGVVFITDLLPARQDEPAAQARCIVLIVHGLLDR